MKIFLIPLAVVGFIFLYPAFEYQTDCPNAYEDIEGNTTCTTIKMILWEATAAMSLYHCDGISMSTLDPELMCCYNEQASRYAADEANYKSIFPFLIITGLTLILEMRRR